MRSTAAVYKHPRSPYWQAHFQTWDATHQQWKPVSKSTRSTDEARALSIAREYERVALAAGPDGSTRLSKSFITAVINDILKISGHRPMQVTTTLRTYSTRWLKAQEARVPRNLTLRSLQTYKSHVANLTDYLHKQADAPIDAITGEDLQQWYNDRLEQGVSVGTMNNTVTTVSSIFQRAIDEGFTARNPAHLVSRSSETGNKRDPFTIEQMQTILTHLRKTKQADWLTVAMLGFYTSQRLSDCAKALRAHFTRGDNWWLWKLTQSKTGKQLSIPLVGMLGDHIDAIMRRTPTSLFVAPSLAEVSEANWNGLSAQFAKILSDCCISGRHIEGKGKGRAFNSLSFHSTRHTCNTLLAQAGIPYETRKLITGHGDLATNLIYTHMDEATAAKALSKAMK